MDCLCGKMVLNRNIQIRFFLAQSLIFYFLLSSCSSNSDQPSSISIRWEQDKATGLHVPLSLLAHTSKDSINKLLHVHVDSEKAQPAILGEWSNMDETLLFEPLIPFTRGLTYEVRLGEQSLEKIQIPSTEAADAPMVVSVYPTSDTLPHNLLKMYVQFSQPMQEGQALKYIQLIKNETDTVRSVFLDLQPELWNTDRTLLTLWLDPGRVKRDLQPNKTMGEPLQKDARYQLFIQPDWQDVNGAALQQKYRKDFVVMQRDSLSPDITKWAIQVPKAGSTAPVEVEFQESLDYALLNHAVHIIDQNGNLVEGKVDVSSNETILNFTPAFPWKTGTYQLECEARLEDIAGNNLNRVFDRDINLVKSDSSKEVFTRTFQIQ
ncbi:Ig-like domain-containing protein [Rhodocytophaga rosea]|uniref:Ig-like domain-containing protein n=1 Tax=Rhodocytophaga rosea TaxID=2704465 RepID=A0A6C0GKX0_9BACT|nr:Ig-like domain-containing protein [Rhodocytophaga rosea]QHT68290.1 Ig-like domain-containing protein [Rhodocytophaga rosea]